MENPDPKDPKGKKNATARSSHSGGFFQGNWWDEILQFWVSGSEPQSSHGLVSYLRAELFQKDQGHSRDIRAPPN